MCGICGLLQLHGEPIDLGAPLDRMNAALRHRGPDDAGAWRHTHVGLAMRRLKVIDLDGSRQPMTNEDGTIVAVFNGEIYNFQELRERLIRHGHVFRSSGDTEVLVHAYEQYGDAMLEHLNGMFAVAIYDTRAHRLMLARDRLGIKPLYYALHNDVLVFASELHALMQSDLVPRSISPAAVDAYFEFLYVPAPDTIYEGVHKLRPGEALVAENGAWHTQRYWRPAYRPDPAWDLPTAAARFRELLDDAVQLQSVSDVPLGAFLSGGMDSSTVVGAMAAHGGRIKTFTVGFDDPEADELRFAKRAAEHFGTDHEAIVLSPDWLSLMPEMVTHFGEPFADSSAMPSWLVSKTARGSVTVALSGDGGDELFAGYTWLHRTRASANLQAAIPWPLRRLLHHATSLLPPSARGAQLRRAAADLLQPPRDVFRRRSSCFTAPQRSLLFDWEVQERIEASMCDRFTEHMAEADELGLDEWMLHQDLRMYLPDDVLTKVDRMSMAHSLEVRVPLLDHRIVEFANTLPFHLKYEGGISKCVMKEAVRDVLPAELLAQRKRGFSVPIQAWFRGPLRAQFADVVLAPGARCRAWVRQHYARALLDEHCTGRENHGHRLWALLTFEHWLQASPGG